MNHLNSVLIEGILTAEPDCSKQKDGLSSCTFAVASTRSVKQGEKLVPEVCSFTMPIIDIEKFEEYMQQRFEYEKDGLDMLEFITMQYGEKASALLAELLF
ncbi:hypothetical protein FACS1894172_17690 [Spirochaetia bacterium]|nr:hypothetical protein FACS1894164_11230 [Spirochaetia bacterium]GHU35634.1 hypothetical protein FACS1894172_17690 [Spirochaetia bacterium]